MQYEPGPVVVGGVGGSGTRIFAWLLREFGLYLGDDLNSALDNQWFGFLLGGRARWHQAKREQIPTALRVFSKAMCGSPSFEPREIDLLEEAVAEWTDWAVEKAGVNRVKAGRWALERVRSMETSGGFRNSASAWGWKNPNTHIYVKHLADVFPRMKYVHVIRNGLDLANKAKTRGQVRAWGPLFGICSGEGPNSPSQKDALRYWIRANRRALHLGPPLFGDRFLVLRYDLACRDPQATVAIMGEFLGIRPTPEIVTRFSHFVFPPESRDLQPETACFDEEEIAEVKDLM